MFVYFNASKSKKLIRKAKNKPKFKRLQAGKNNPRDASSTESYQPVD